jgi:DNA-binding transcriptional MerR regulator
MLPIGRFSRLCRISIKSLRHYDELGLLKPAEVDEASGYRYYDLAQAERAERIRLFRTLDMPLDEIREFLDEKDGAAARQKIEHHLRRVEADLSNQREVLASLKQLLWGRAGEPPSVGLRPVDSCPIAGISARVPFPDRGRAVSRALLAIYGALGEAGIPPNGPPTAIFDEAGDDEDELPIEVAVPIAAAVALGPTVHTRVLVGGLAASIIHQGGYAGLSQAHRSLVAWMIDHGHDIGGPLREIYLVGPGATTNPGEYRTELLLPIGGHDVALRKRG